MESPVIKYKESKEHKTLLLKVLSGQKWPWIIKGIETTIRTLGTPLQFIKPVREWLGKTYGGANGKLFRLIREKKYEEGYIFGIDRLRAWLAKMPNPESVRFIPLSNSWWFAFNSVCQCALETNHEEALSVLGEFVEKGPGPKEGYPVVESFYYLSRLAYNRKNPEASWDWIERAIECDDSYGWAYYFRAWLGIIMGKGQPLEDLMACIKNEPNLKSDIFNDELFKSTPNLLDDLGVKL